MAYLTAIEASKHLGVSERTVRRWIEEGKLVARHLKKNKYGILEADVEALLAERPDIIDENAKMKARIEALEQRVHELERTVARLEGQQTALQESDGKKMDCYSAASLQKTIVADFKRL